MQSKMEDHRDEPGRLVTDGLGGAVRCPKVGVDLSLPAAVGKVARPPSSTSLPVGLPVAELPRTLPFATSGCHSSPLAQDNA